MELELKRQPRINDTRGQLFINGEFFCWTLEDIDRKLEVAGCPAKIPKITCIPKGKYEVIINYSERFKKYMPLLLNVKCFEGVRIHNGSYTENTDGCLLVGKQFVGDVLSGSKTTFAKLMAELKKVEKKEKITIEIV